jgi:tetratricopeptide (TPR) repeat protein
VIQQDLGLSPQEFDKQYQVWIDKQYGAEAGHFDEWHTRLRNLVASEEHQDYRAVLNDGPAVLALYPQYVEDANAYELIAAADKALGDTKAEEAILAQYEHAGGQSPDALKQLATLEAAAGDNASAIATLERINYIYPVKDEDLHHRLGDLLYAQKNYGGAIREFNALAASNPVDKAGAAFELAQAYYAAGQKDKAQDSVLAALEIAPDYRPAQKLLLQIQASTAKSN